MTWPATRAPLTRVQPFADAGVVADVRADHEEVAVADPGLAPPLRGPAMDRHVLAEDVLVADPEPGRLAAIALVLGALAQHGAMADEVVASPSSAGRSGTRAPR